MRFGNTTVNDDTLSNSYHESQKARIAATRDRIVESVQLISSGRVIPETPDLVIGTGRRLEATVLFLDICRFSQRPAESAGEQEFLLRILNLFFTEMIHIVEDYGGVVEKNTGDGLMAYFAPDSARPGDVRKRALAAALTMFHAANYFINPILINTPVQPLSFRVCLDHGWITIARVGAARRFNNIVAVGTTANLASKMLAKAGDNSILLGDSILPGLPSDWIQQFISLNTRDTGWTYRESGSPYCFWNYLGRWRLPT
jgi:adenylate cyclase